MKFLSGVIALSRQQEKIGYIILLHLQTIGILGLLRLVKENQKAL